MTCNITGNHWYNGTETNHFYYCCLSVFKEYAAERKWKGKWSMAVWFDKSSMSKLCICPCCIAVVFNILAWVPPPPQGFCLWALLLTWFHTILMSPQFPVFLLPRPYFHSRMHMAAQLLLSSACLQLTRHFKQCKYISPILELFFQLIK